MKVQLFFPASFACLTALILVLRFTEVQPQPDFKVSQYVKYEKDEEHFIEVRLEVKGLSIGNYAPSLWIGDDKFDGFRTEQIQGSISTLIGFDVPLDESTNRLEKLCVTLESVQKDCRFWFPSIHDIQPGNPLEDDKLAVGGRPPDIPAMKDIKFKVSQYIIYEREETKFVEVRLKVNKMTVANAAPSLWIGGKKFDGYRTKQIETLINGNESGSAYHGFDIALKSAAELEDKCVQFGFYFQGLVKCAYRFPKISDISPGKPLIDDMLTTGGIPPLLKEMSHILPACGRPNVGLPEYQYVLYDLYDSQENVISHDNRLEIGETISIAMKNLPPLRQIEIQILGKKKKEFSYARLTANSKGEIPRTILWYNTGITGRLSSFVREGNSKSTVGRFSTYKRAKRKLKREKLKLSIKAVHLKKEDNVKFKKDYSIPISFKKSKKKPLLFPSDEKGTLMNSVNVEEDFYVTGMNHRSGKLLYVYIVENRYTWKPGDSFEDVRGNAEKVEVKKGKFRFKVRGGALPKGSYDLIARVVPDSLVASNHQHFHQILLPDDIVPFRLDTAVVMFEIINGHIVMDIAGREIQSGPTWFEFGDVFESGEDVYGAVDPTDVPVVHTGGDYAAYYVVEKQPAAYWDSIVPPPLIDISGPGGTSQIEVSIVKFGCINLSRTNIWPSATISGTECEKEYQVIVEFGESKLKLYLFHYVSLTIKTNLLDLFIILVKGASPASSIGTYVTDAVYNKGKDFIDRYPEQGFTLITKPCCCIKHGCGRHDYYEDSSSIIPNGYFDMTSLGFPLVRNWFTIRYPSSSTTGSTCLTGAPISNPGPFPVVLLLHGRHCTCASGGCFNPTCSAADRIASHRGYDYILDLLAKRGFIAISVDAYDIQPSNSINNYEARGKLVLEHLSNMKSWNDIGNDPFGGNFFLNKIDMTKVAIGGHSRGGEGVVSAADLNSAVGYNYGIKAVISLGPTDQQAGTKWDAEKTPFLTLIGAADGDVWNFQGFGPYDRAYPTSATTQFEKSMLWIHGANHNFWNTVWTPSFGVDPYASDDGAFMTGPRITEAEQRETGLNSIYGFVLQHLLDLEPYRQIFTGKLLLSAMPNDAMYWSYQHPDRKTVDDYENLDVWTNTLSGAANFLGTPFLEGDIGYCSFHENNNDSGVLTWVTSNESYESLLPLIEQDVSSYTHISFRIAQVHPHIDNPVGLDREVKVYLYSSSNSRWALSSDFSQIPYPYERSSTSRPCQMNTVRIPLKAFTRNNSGVDLTAIEKVKIEFLAAGKVGIDDLHFTK